MKHALLALPLLLLPALLGGCGGYYILSVPDQIGPVEGDIVPISRLQRQEVFLYFRPQDGTSMRFRVFATEKAAMHPAGDRHVAKNLLGQERAARTDELGYAAVAMSLGDAPVNNKPGVYAMKVSLQDATGEEKQAITPIYVWEVARPVIAVDVTALPKTGDATFENAQKALNTIAKTANIIYLTREDAPTHKRQHQWLADNGYPDGPVRLWQREQWHIVRSESLGLPQIVIETRLVSQLADLRQKFTNLKTAIAGSRLAAKAFKDAGISYHAVGAGKKLLGDESANNSSWKDLLDQWSQEETPVTK
jgi:hypothetical protein